MPDPTTAEVLGNRGLKSAVHLPAGRRNTVIAAVVAAQLWSTGLAIGAPGLTTTVTVAVEGRTGQWAHPESSVAAPAATVTTGPATDQPVVTTTSIAPETSTVTATDTAPVDEPSSSNQPEPTPS